MKAIIIGCGYWGNKIINTLEEIQSIEIVGIYDNNPLALEKYKDKYATFTDHCYICKIEHDIQFIVTRANSHFELAKKALENNKHVFLEKPMTLNSKEAIELINLSEIYNKLLCVDHTFLFSPEVSFFKDFISKEPRSFKFFESKRINKGPLVKDINVIFDLSPHDFSILNYIVPFKPIGISASGISVINNVIEKCHITVYYNVDFKAFIDVSWLEQDKIREIRVIDKYGLELKHCNIKDKNFIFSSYIHNDISTSDIKCEKSPLYNEIMYFLNCVENNQLTNIISCYNGLKVMKMIESADLSVRKNGEMIRI